MEFVVLPAQPSYLAPDGSEVRLLVVGGGGGMAHFKLAPEQVSDPKRHHTVEELWYCIAGAGWIVLGDSEPIMLRAGTSVRIPPRTRFQFRCDGTAALEVVGCTIPPWPGEQEAEDAEPFWPN